MRRPDVVNEFESWAKVSSRLLGKSDAEQAELLVQLDLTAVWENANVAWAKALADDIVNMRLDRAQRYAEICSEVLGAPDAEDLDRLSLSMSDDLSRQTTLKMRPHPGEDAPPSFVDSLTPTRPVRPPQRKQADTYDAPRSFELPPSEDSGETSIYEDSD